MGKRLFVLFACGFVLLSCASCGPGGTALLALLLTQKEEKKKSEPLRPPAKAHSPQPIYDAMNVPVTTNLSWAAADTALSYDIYFGTDGEAVDTATTSSPEYKGNLTNTHFDPAPAGNLNYDTTYYWRVDSLNAAGTTKGDDWKFTTEPAPTTPPDKVTGENPFNGETDVSVDVVLSWDAAARAESYDVYFGTDAVAVANADTTSYEFIGNQTGLSYDPPGNLDYETTYYWRIDSVNAVGTTKGDVWKFATKPAGGGGQIWYVDAVSGNDLNGGTGWDDAFATIGKALSVATDGDTVFVADAIYNETNLNLNGKKIYLKGVDHHTAGAQPVIDCGGSGRAFYFGSGETKDSVIDNFTIQNGTVRGGEDGGAIFCYSSSPTVTNCTFSGNSADFQSGAIYCDGSSPTITNCAFSGNDAAHGGAIFCYSSSPTVTNCTFSGNSADFGGAIYCDSSSPRAANCTFSGNSAGDGGAIFCYYNSSPTLNNCILWGNTAGGGGDEVYIEDSGSSCTLNYCCVEPGGYDNAGTITENSCINDNPQFEDAAGGNLRLQPTSPCIDKGNNNYVPAGVTTDLDGNPRIVNSTVDIGAYEYQH